jgi:hypothetical protein
VGNILFEWNVLTVSLVFWWSIVVAAMCIDFGPDMYRESVTLQVAIEETKARFKQARPIDAAIAQWREAKRQQDAEMELIPLVIIKRPDPVRRRRHAKA